MVFIVYSIYIRYPPQYFLYLREIKAKVLSGLQRFGNNLAEVGAGAVALTLWFLVSDIY